VPKGKNPVLNNASKDANQNMGSDPASSPTKSCGSAPAPKQAKRDQQYWLEIQLVDEQQNAISGEEYRARLPDGSPAEGYLDDDGWTRIEGITTAGACQISFPNLDQAACKFLQSTGRRGAAGPIRSVTRNAGYPDPTGHSINADAGQCCSSIAYANGHLWPTIWNAPQNASLRLNGRDDPNCLVPGESVYIPAIKPFQYSGNTNLRHRFMFKGLTNLVMRILYSDGAPRANVRCVLTVDGKAAAATTTADGKVSFPIHPLTTDCTLKVPGDGVVAEQTFQLQCGSLAPHNTLAGVQQRLVNLGTWDVPVDGKNEAKTEEAVKFLQKSLKVPATGTIAQNVWDSLRTKYGS
jgi:hypothetical protein